MTVSVLWIFLVVQWVSLHCVVVLYPDPNYSPKFLRQEKRTTKEGQQAINFPTGNHKTARNRQDSIAKIHMKQTFEP